MGEDLSGLGGGFRNVGPGGIGMRVARVLGGRRIARVNQRFGVVFDGSENKSCLGLNRAVIDTSSYADSLRCSIGDEAHHYEFIGCFDNFGNFPANDIDGSDYTLGRLKSSCCGDFSLPLNELPYHLVLSDGCVFRRVEEGVPVGELRERTEVFVRGVGEGIAKSFGLENYFSSFS